MDTGTLERVANWSPVIVDAVDPCDPGTDPRTGPFLQVSPAVVPLNLTLTVRCPSAWWYAATCPTRWPRSVVQRDLRLVGALWACALVSIGSRSVLFILFPFDTWPLPLTNVFSWYFRGLFEFVSVSVDLLHCGGLSTYFPLSGRLFSLGVCHFQELWWPTTSWF